QSPLVVGLGEALPVQDAPAAQLGKWEQKAIGRDQLHRRVVWPAGGQLPEDACRGRLAGGDRGGCTPEKGGRLSVQLLASCHVQVQQARKWQVQIGDLEEVDRLAEAT